MIFPTTPPENETLPSETPTEALEPQVIEVTPTVEIPVQTGDPVTVVAPTASDQLATPTTVPSLLPQGLQTPKTRPATMKITRPGPYSKVSSPINLEALISPSEDRLVYLNVIGEDGRMIVSQILDFRSYNSQRFNISQKIPFQINSAAELARIELYIKDQFNQVVQLVSVDVLLIQYGDSDETASEIELEPYLINSPGEGTLIKGGVLEVEGSARLVSDGPLIVELINEKGVVVGQGETQVSPPSESISHMPFQVTIPYTVEGRTRARLTVRQESTNRIPGTVWLLSSVVFLDP